jgi:hypothetical protein
MPAQWLLVFVLRYLAAGSTMATFRMGWSAASIAIFGDGVVK